jgi:hypothetical protein
LIPLVFIRFFPLVEYTALTKSLKIEESLVLDLKILMYRNADEIEKLKKIKTDSDKEMLEALQKLKELSESRDALQQELEELKVAAQAVVDIVEIPEDNADEPLTLAGKLQKVPQCLMRYVSETTRYYMGHVLGLVKSYWPHTPLDPLGEGAKADCSDDQFDQYLTETSPIADRIVDSLSKS